MHTASTSGANRIVLRSSPPSLLSGAGADEQLARPFEATLRFELLQRPGDFGPDCVALGFGEAERSGSVAEDGRRRCWATIRSGLGSELLRLSTWTPTEAHDRS